MSDLNQIDSAVQSGAAKVSGVAIGPQGVQQLSPEEAKAALDAAAQAAEQQKMLVMSLMKRLQGKCDEVVKAKRPIEHRMVDDIRQYDGVNRLRSSKTDTTSVSSNREAPVIHATRSRTDALESRLSDMLFPNNDHAWDMTCTPDDEWESPDAQDPVTQTYGVLPPNGPPQAPQAAPQQPPPQAQAQQPGQPPAQPGAAQGQPQAPQPPSPEDIKQQYTEKCEAACAAMKKVIQDQLAECKFTSAGRRMVRDGCRYGYGVVGGPFSTIKIQRRFRGPNMEMRVKEVPIPAIEYKDPWCFFPDMVPSMDKAEFVFYLNLMSGREVQELADNPGFNKEEIIKLLKEEPDLGEAKINIHYRNEHLDRIEPTTGRYGVWRYTGTLERKDLDALAPMFPDLQDDMNTVLKDDQGQDLQTIPMVDMWYCQNHPLKVRIRPIEKDFRVPYYVFSPFPADDTVFGYGIPYLTRDSARVVNAAWAMALHNASVSAGPIIVSREGKIEPRDRSYEFKGPKWMMATDPDMPLDDLLKVMNIDNNGAEGLAMLDRALQILDDEAMTPQVLQGDATQSVPTSSGLAMLFNAASIVMRRAASCFDDEVGQQIIQRMYWWNMLYNDRQDIKGDFDVVPLGQAKMLVKDVQLQHLQAFMQQSMNPALAPFINLPQALKLWTNLLDLPDEVLNDIQTVQQQMQNQPNPQQDLANAKVQQTLAQAHELTTRAQANAIKAQAGAQGNPGIDPAEVQMHQEDLAVRREEAQASVTAKTLELQAEMAKLHQLHDSTVQNNVTKIHLGHVKAATDIHNKGMSAQIEAAKLAHANKQGQQQQ